ncbi:MAG TPA: hypothetical protein PLO78_06110 [Candidatus Omnitrophota bacterium]|nr:hypothetical protein [Candidatus Omnitrophota bacterium]
MEKLKDKTTQSNLTNSQGVSAHRVSKKSFSLWGFLNVAGPMAGSGEHGKTLLKEPSKGPVFQNSPSSNTSKVRKWVGLEEKVVRDYKRKSLFPFEKSVPATKPAANVIKSPALEKQKTADAFIAQTVTLSSSPLSRPIGPVTKKKESVVWIFLTFLILAGLPIGTFVLFHPEKFRIKTERISQEMLATLASTQAENKKLENVYSKLQNVSTDQRNEIRRLNFELRNLSEELKSVRKKETVLSANEKSYRSELMRITAQYEIQLDTMRQQIAGRDEIIMALKAQIKAFEKIIDESGFAGVAGAASHMAVRGQASMSFQDNPSANGKVTLIHDRYRFIVINMGAQQGARFGQRVNIYQEGRKITEGVVDRVYPTISAVTISDRFGLSMIREGDAISFSN